MYDERVRALSSAPRPGISVAPRLKGPNDNRKQIVEKFSFAGDFATALSGDSWFFNLFF